jgi:hypothetical protein
MMMRWCWLPALPVRRSQASDCLSLRVSRFVSLKDGAAACCCCCCSCCTSCSASWLGGNVAEEKCWFWGARTRESCSEEGAGRCCGTHDSRAATTEEEAAPESACLLATAPRIQTCNMIVAYISSSCICDWGGGGAPVTCPFGSHEWQPSMMSMKHVASCWLPCKTHPGPARAEGWGRKAMHRIYLVWSWLRWPRWENTRQGGVQLPLALAQDLTGRAGVFNNLN